MDGRYEVIGSQGCGSAIVEMALVRAGLPHDVTELPYLADGPGRDRLLALNPLGQVPTLVLPDGRVLTESAAMLLHVADVAPDAGLTPAADAPERAAFLDVLIRIVAAIYPTFTYGDRPEIWTGPGEAAATLKARTDERRLAVFRELDGRLAGASRFAFGERAGAVDLYLAAMVFWRPGRATFRRETPRLSAIAEAVASEPELGAVLKRNGLAEG
ncbi:glutathione S-transferase family protein [Oharaeibacter diazotrophicus]|uniref:GST-like protein n=1 Tax=Oharaeibacter diazotrophicus TaxID=1920512 RepID=A0A4R6RFV4_9HYPH|nr:glutathione S-transferase family protein [Oharaeibacter diazotrophicus]TDP84985.1 GST-like protein [Oharaeibacter diazotrophicus]BBE73954.1 glutathione S-transferase GST-6.0 [Pleomorphomonas sp. SM30]GLS76359.1 glutathione S-transferase [Oharaeibacter diazotrophicus]